MAYDPAQEIQIRVEILTTLGWVDITSRGRKASCVIRQGRSPGAIQSETSRLSLTLGNPDGYLTEDNAISPYYGSWGSGCEIRVSRLGLTVSPAERFHGQIDSIIERFPGGDIDATVEVTAIGTLGIVEKGSDALRSPLFRSMAGIASGDYVPDVFYSLEDGSGATSFSSGLSSGDPVPIGSGVTPGSDSTMTGSSSLATVAAGSSQRIRLPLFTDTGRWHVVLFLKIPSQPASDTVFVQIPVRDGTAGRVEFAIAPGSPTVWQSRVYDTAGTLLETTSLLTPSSELTTPGDAYGNWFTVVLGLRDGGGGNFKDFGHIGFPFHPGGGGGGTNAGAPGRPTEVVILGGDAGVAVGHVGLFTSTSYDPLTDSNANLDAITGYAGETAGDRMIRLCREEDVSFELVGDADDTPPMGPQLIDTLLVNLRDCESADQGLMHDNGTDGAIVHVTRRHLYDQTATIAVTKGAIEPTGVAPIRDRRYMRNDITSSRPNGGSARIADESHIAKVKARLKDTRQPNVETDDQLRDDASWAVHLGTAKGARYDSVGINLRNADGALLADQVAAHAIGERITVAKTALPPQHHIDGIDGLTIGWTEILDAVDWRFAPNVIPYAPYDVAKYDADRYDSDSTFLAEDLDTTETAVDVVAAEDKLPWITGSGGAVFTNLFVGTGGEKMSVSAIASVLLDPFNRSASNGWSSAPTGQAYTVSGTASEYSATGSVGRMSLVNVSDLHLARADIGSTNTLVVGSVTIPVLPGGGGITARLAARLADTSNYYEAQILIATTGVVTLQIFKRVAGAGSSVSSAVTLPWLHAAGNKWRIKFSCFDTSLKARAWNTNATSEPRRNIWFVSGTDPLLTTGTQIACLARRETGNTDASVNVDFDDVETITPQRFTVARSQNGVVKTHTAGAQLRLWTPPYYGY